MWSDGVAQQQLQGPSHHAESSPEQQGCPPGQPAAFGMPIFFRHSRQASEASAVAASSMANDGDGSYSGGGIMADGPYGASLAQQQLGSPLVNYQHLQSMQGQHQLFGYAMAQPLPVGCQPALVECQPGMNGQTPCVPPGYMLVPVAIPMQQQQQPQASSGTNQACAVPMGSGPMVYSLDSLPEGMQQHVVAAAMAAGLSS